MAKTLLITVVVILSSFTAYEVLGASRFRRSQTTATLQSNSSLGQIIAGIKISGNLLHINVTQIVKELKNLTDEQVQSVNQALQNVPSITLSNLNPLVQGLNATADALNGTISPELISLGQLLQKRITRVQQQLNSRVQALQRLLNSTINWLEERLKTARNDTKQRLQKIINVLIKLQSQLNKLADETIENIANKLETVRNELVKELQQAPETIQDALSPVVVNIHLVIHFQT